MARHRRRLCALAGCAVATAALATVSVLAQSTTAGPVAAETFDVISVKPNQSGDGNAVSVSNRAADFVRAT